MMGLRMLMVMGMIEAVARLGFLVANFVVVNVNVYAVVLVGMVRVGHQLVLRHLHKLGNQR